VADVRPEDGGGLVSRDALNVHLGNTTDGSARDKSGPETMGCEVSLKPGGDHRLLDDAGDVAITESAVLEEEWGVATSREGEAAEERAAGLDVRLLDPPPESCNGTDR